MLRKTSLTLCCALLLCSCDATPKPFNGQGITSYKEAIAWVESSYNAETVHPNSSNVFKMVYFEEGEFMVVYFRHKKSKGYLHQHVSRKFWEEFKSASSKGKFYHKRIKGNKTMYLKLES